MKFIQTQTKFYKSIIHPINLKGFRDLGCFIIPVKHQFFHHQTLLFSKFDNYFLNNYIRLSGMKTSENCKITNKEYPSSELVDSRLVREDLLKNIKIKYPDWNGQGYICISIVNEARNEYMRKLLEDDKGELNNLDQEVLKSLQSEEILTKKLNVDPSDQYSYGEKIADKVAAFGGSWTFIILFLGIIIVWITGNVVMLMNKPFDPYPFILLNLVLSCIAALQAPVIMMSQNRQEAKDRLRAQNDYQVNIKAEIEIRQLHEKIDHLLLQQHQRLFEVQEMQMDILEEILNKVSDSKNGIEDSKN